MQDTTNLIFHIQKPAGPFKGSPGTHFQLASCSVGITSSCLLVGISALCQPCVVTSTLPLLVGISNPYLC